MSSITTKTGDKGESGIRNGDRLPKTDQHFEALGAIDEFNAALGLAKVNCRSNEFKVQIEALQRSMIALGAEVATPIKDYEKFTKEFLPEGAPEKIFNQVKLLESSKKFTAFELPGSSPCNAALHLARTICRRAEREVWKLQEAGLLKHDLPCVYLNRVSDLLWIMAETYHE